MIDPNAFKLASKRLFDLAPWPKPQLERFLEVFKELEPARRYRLSPNYLAEKINLDLATTAELMLFAVKAGLLRMTWASHCPSCGSLVHGMGELNQLEQNFYCTLCELDNSNELDDQVEINFSLAAEIAEPNFDPFRSYVDYTYFLFSEHIRRSEEFSCYLKDKAFQHYIGIDPGESATINYQGQPGELLRLLSLENDARIYIDIGQGPGQGEVTLRPAGFDCNRIELGSGPVRIIINNQSGRRAGFMLLLTDMAKLNQILQKTPPYFAPFLSGKQMLNSQHFRELFPVQSLPVDLSLKVRDQCILFTDLKGSTELYGKTGDIAAYKLVRRHFELLTDAVKTHRGAIVKTMGDAIMASFNEPADGLEAAFMMIEEVNAFNLSKGEEKLGLKIGLHRGRAIAVNANQSLDFFGQTVNLAARVQGLAQAGEIWITEPVHQDPKVRQLITGHHFDAKASKAHLKGIVQEQAVFCLVKT